MSAFRFKGFKAMGLLVCLTTPFSSSASQDWKKYPSQPKGTKIKFPTDEGHHPLNPGLEWWYVVMHVTGKKTGNRYSILVTHFNNSIRFFTMTNVTEKTHHSASTYGALKAKSTHLELEHKTPFGIDKIETKTDIFGKLIPFEYKMETHHSKMNLKAELTLNKAPLLVGGDGYVPIGNSGHSWYYSLTRLQVEGRLQYLSVEEEIEGLAWMDHQWGPFLISPVRVGPLFESYEWFCIQLDDGTDIMISNIFDRQRKRPNDSRHGGTELFLSNGVQLRSENVDFKRTRYWKDPSSGHYMSMGWTLNVPEWDLSLTLTPDFEEQMVNFPLNGDFWEGSIKVSGDFKGKAVSGKAYGELMHRYKVPKLRVSITYVFGKKNTYLVKWKVRNPDDGNPLTFDLNFLSDSGVKTEFLKNSSKTSIEIVPSLILKNKKGHFEVTAYSVDKTIKGSSRSRRIKF